MNRTTIVMIVIALIVGCTLTLLTRKKVEARIHKDPTISLTGH